MTEPVPVAITVNRRTTAAQVEPRTTLADFLRDVAGCTSVHLGCEQGACGACTVLLDGEPARSCLVLAVQACERAVLTVEGLARDEEWHPLQEAFRDAHSFQCGFCTPGFVLTAYALLTESERDGDDVPPLTQAEIRDALAGCLCRCTGYQSIVEGVALAVARMREPRP